MSHLQTREQVKSDDKWAIEDLYSSEVAWEKEYRKAKEAAEELSQRKGTLGNSAESLLSFLTMDDKLSMLLERVAVYAHQRYHENTANTVYQELSDRADNLTASISAMLSFAVPELLEIPDELLNQFLAENEELRVYEVFLKEITRQKAHTRSEEIETILADSGEIAKAPSNIYSMFNNADLKFMDIEDEEGKTLPVTHGSFSALLRSGSRKVRKEAFESVYREYDRYKNTLASTFYSNIKKEMFYAKTRNYTSTIERRLFDSNVPVAVYDNLIDSVHKNLPLLHRYMSLRKRLMNLDELHLYDLYVPIVSDADASIDFDKAKSMVYEGLKPLGEEYLSILKEGFDNRWIDIYENEGKRSGAYSWGAYGTHPYVLLNYQDNLNHVFTLAHEMGHAIHSYCSDEKQPYVYAAYKIFVAEVASTCNEALLMEDLLSKTEDKKQRAYLINYFLEQFRTTLYRQTMFAEFEKEMHKKAEEGSALTEETLGKAYYELNEKYFGNDVVIDPQIRMEWSRIPHFYTPFYVYQYATGYSAAIALSRKILKEGEPAVSKYIDFISSGSSDYPIELLKKAGVDMTTTEPVDTALQVFKELLDELEELL